MSGTRGFEAYGSGQEGVSPQPGESCDALFRGRLRLLQAERGYRFGLDALLLCDFVALRGDESILDLGCGNGTIALVLASRFLCAKVVGLELQPAMVARARRNAALNGLAERVEILEGDVREARRLCEGRSFDLAVSNPPFRAARSGRLNPDPEKRIARHEIAASLEDFLAAGRSVLRDGGRFALIFPAPRAVDLIAGMRAHGLEPKRVRMVHSFADAPASLILAEGVKGGSVEVETLPPLVVYRRGDRYTPEVERILEGGLGLAGA
jgi:tRNA1Val (adenine37-N6)-methyltransferase